MIRRLVARGWQQFMLLAAMITFAGLIAQNLVYWQVTRHSDMAQQANQIYDSATNVPAARGDIVDANLAPLATDVPAYLIAADPQVIPNHTKPNTVNSAAYDAAKLWHVLGGDPGRLLHLLETPHTEYVVIARQVDQATADRIKALQLNGIIVTNGWRTWYPQPNSLAAAVLGFVDANGVGQYGLEAEYNSILHGQDGSQLLYVDTAHQSLPVGMEKPHPPVKGASLVLTIDARIQAIVEQRLAAAIKRYGAQSGTGIVMDPHTGAILAMTSLPSFNPNHYSDPQYTNNPQLYNNLALARYQPGSTYKTVSVATGLDSGAFTPQTTVLDYGIYQQDGITIRNWDLGNGWGIETPEDMLRHSANVGMAQFANKIAPPTYYNYLVNHFGFNAQTGIDLPNESPGAVRTPEGGNWQHSDQLVNSYGQGLDVTPLQMVTAVAALANHGVRVRPYIVQRIVYANDRVVDTKPHVVGQAVSPATAATMTDILQKSAYQGEAMCALTSNYPVAAKTGTATIEQPAAHGLNLTQGTVASLIGYAPANNPRFVMLITIRHPQPGPTGQNIYGSVVAAPAWHDIALRLYNILNIPPQPGSTPATLTKEQGRNDYNCAFMSQQ